MKRRVDMTSLNVFFFFQAEDGVRGIGVTGVQTWCSSDLCSARAATCSLRIRASSEYASSGHQRKVRTGTPAASTSRCAHRPSATSSRSRLDAVLFWMSSTCLTRGWDRPICCSSTGRVSRTGGRMTSGITVTRVVAMVDHNEDSLYLQSFGRRLSALRVQRGLSQEELAEASGLRVAEVRRVERGQRDLPVAALADLARALSVEPADLMP